MVAFRKLTGEDFPLMLEWLAKSHVKEWWNDGDDTIEKVALHFGEEEWSVKRFILFETENGKALGYFQYYFADDGSIGIDQFIGEEDHTNRGVGTRAIKKFVKMIFKKHRPPRIFLDPSPANKRAIRCYEKVGFAHYKTVIKESGERAFMMQIKRSDFQN